MKLLNSGLFVLLSTLLLFGCSKNVDESDSVSDMPGDDNPYASYAGDWMTEAYASDAMEGAEPLVVVLIKATDENQGWSWKFTHLEEAVMSSNIFMQGDTVVTVSNSYPSALREGETVSTLTNYIQVHGDEMSGRFVAVYESGDTVHGRLAGERLK